MFSLKATTVIRFCIFATVCSGLLHEWDPETEPWEDFHIRHCGMVCDNGTLVNLNKYRCPYPRCFHCDCHPVCSSLDTCCPHGTMQPNRTFVRQEREPNTSQTYPPYTEQIKCMPIPFNTYNHLQVVGCPSVFGNALSETPLQVQIRELCARESYKAQDLLSFLAYIDVESGLLFKNKFCALCNGYRVYDNNNFSTSMAQDGETFSIYDIKVAEPWPLHVKCNHYQELYTLTSPLDFIKSASRKLRTSLCNVFYKKPPSQHMPRWCFRNTPEDYEVSFICKEPVLSLCRNLNHTYLTVSGHKNLFCAMCSGINPVLLSYNHCRHEQRLWVTIDGNEGPISPLSLLSEGYKIRESFQTETDKICTSKMEWGNDTGECQPALCSVGKIANESGDCVSAIDQIRGLGYEVFLVLQPENTIRLSTEEVQGLAEDISEGILDRAKEGKVHINISVSLGKANSCSSARLEQISLSASLAGNESLSRDEYERDLIEYLTRGRTFQIKDTNKDITLKSAMLGLGFEYLVSKNATDEGCTVPLPPKFIEHQTQSSYPSFEPFSYNVVPTTPQTEIVSTSLCEYYMSDACSPEPDKLVYRKMFSSIPQTSMPGPIWRFQDKFIDLRHSLTCPFVKMNISSRKVQENTVEFEFSYFGNTFSTNSTDHVAVVDDDLQICIEAFKRITAHIVIKSNKSTLVYIRYYLEIICLCLSVVCLFISAITYCLFRSLRSLPGLNNLSLCVSLAVAQICLIITAQHGAKEQLPSGYCFAHAVLLHYSWLAAFAWMSICCIHMFRVFSTHDNKFLNSSSDGKRYRVYCVYGYGLPALIVIATYAINAGVSSGRHSGYRDDKCFLDSRQSVWTIVLALLVPLCVVMFSNGVMFALTVREIANVSRAHGISNNGHRQGVITYVKLSTITGLLGAVTVVAIQLDIRILSLITAPLMSLQGVFIFISFICNNKVRLLYLDLLRKCGLPCQSKGHVNISKTSRSTSATHNTHASTSKFITTTTRI